MQTGTAERAARVRKNVTCPCTVRSGKSKLTQQEAHAVSLAASKRHPRSYRSSYRKWYRKMGNGNNRDPNMEDRRVIERS
jgi:hypothetical protein